MPSSIRRHAWITAWGACGAGALAGILLITLISGRSLPTIPAPSNVATAIPAPLTSPYAVPVSYAKPVWIRIPAISVSAPITSVGLNSDGTLHLPPLTERNLAAWYDKGAAPGERGPAVVVGHVDSYLGPSVFFDLHALRRGDMIEIGRERASSLIFTVSQLQQVSKTGFPTQSVYGPISYPALRLITCGGTFNATRGSYEDNVIVYATLTRPV